MNNLSFIINIAIVFGIGFELILILLGKLNADQLLISSGLSGLLILVSFKLLKDGLSKLFKLPEHQKEVVNDEINIMDEINAHIALKIALQKVLDRQADAKVDLDQIMSDDQCTLGKWLNGPAQKYFGESNRGIKILKEQHERLHVAAGFVVRNIQNNDLPSARKIMNGEFKKAFHDVTMTLNVLNSVLLKN